MINQKELRGRGRERGVISKGGENKILKSFCGSLYNIYIYNNIKVI